MRRRELGLFCQWFKMPGRIWPRDALLDVVWGRDADSTDRTVDTHIKTLRAKLLDMAIVCQIIQLNGGELRVVQAQAGSSVSLGLPCWAG
ncbi:MAG: winged helix-turn-helix domain-containing protein [Pseudomonadota bacterium]